LISEKQWTNGFREKNQASVAMAMEAWPIGLWPGMAPEQVVSSSSHGPVPSALDGIRSRIPASFENG